MQANGIKRNIKFVLIVMLICYLPNLISIPMWLSIFVLSMIGYRLLAVYVDLVLPPFGARLSIIVIGFLLLMWQYRVITPNGFYIDLFLLCASFKCLETCNLRDLRVLMLCNFYVILTVLLLHQELWIFMYVLLSAMLNLAIMIKLTAPQIDFKHTGTHFLKHFLYAIPITLMLFYLFPRLSHPLWSVSALSQTKIGFNDEMTIRNMSDTFNDDSTVMRVIFNKEFKPTLYWRGVVLTQFNGLVWKPANQEKHPFKLLNPIDPGKEASYEITLEPHQKKWLFYQNIPIAATPNLMFSDATGLVQQDMSLVYYRLKYALVDTKEAYQPISKATQQENTYLPPYGNLQLRKWAQQQFAMVNNNPQALISVIAYRINQQPYWYSLVTESPGFNVNLMDKFWFQTKRGYCEYYTGAVAIILRAVGIPARIILGYHGGRWNPVAHYLTVQQNDAHAWLEYWQEGKGWQRLDPVGFIHPSRVEGMIQQKQADETIAGEWNQYSATLSWLSRFGYLLESMQFFWERWLLFYNADTQHDLLQKIGLQQWDEINLLQLFIAVLVMLFIMTGIWYLIRQQSNRDPIREEYHRLQREMSLLNINIKPPATLIKQLQELKEKYPHLKEVFHAYIEQYEHIRFHHNVNTAENRKTVLHLLRQLRAQLKHI